ncbi:MAG: DUF4404 family protein [Acidimicrobiales bacterium]
MDLHLREQLEELGRRLHLHRGAGEERAGALRADVQRALDDDEHHGLVDRLEEEAVEFETDHPDLAAFLRQAANTLSAAGI